jgi:hypothetical protein
MFQQHFAEPADARSVIERTLDHGRLVLLDRLPTGVVQRYVELEMSRVAGPVGPGHALPPSPAVRVHARLGWERFLMVPTIGSGVGAAAVVDLNGYLVEITTLARAAATGTVTTVSEHEGQSILRVLTATRPVLISCVSAALAGAQEVTLV